MNLTTLYEIPVGLQIHRCKRCGCQIVPLTVRERPVEVEYPSDGRIIGKLFPAHECRKEAPCGA